MKMIIVQNLILPQKEKNRPSLRSCSFFCPPEKKLVVSEKKTRQSLQSNQLPIHRKQNFD